MEKENEENPEIRPAKRIELNPVELTMEYRCDGGVDIKLDDFVYVSVHYDYRYTDNASRARLAEYIVKRLAAPPFFPHSEIRILRKNGFMFVQAKPGENQPHEKQMERARAVARSLFPYAEDSAIESAAEAILQSSWESRERPEFF